MIIPIRCISCNNPIAGKWLTYVKKVLELRKAEGRTSDIVYLNTSATKTAEGKVLDELGIKRTCCRRHFLTHVDLV